MKLKLSRDTMENVADIASAKLGRGQQIHMNHTGCPAGDDSRGRLYIKATDDGKLVLAHCFNCGASGHIFLTTSINPRTKDLREYNIRLESFNRDLQIWNSGASCLMDKDCWPSKYFSDCWDEFVAANGFDIRNCILWTIFPRGNADKPTGFESRSISTKLYTRVIHPDYMDQSRLLIYNNTISDCAIICEDPISAMKISLAGYAGVSLCGSSISPDDVFKLSMLYSNVLVWLDNDKREIKAQAKGIHDRLLMYMDNVKMNAVDNDPKHHTLSYIKGVVEGAFK